MKQTNRRTFTAEFKKQMVQLYQNGKARQEIIEGYRKTGLGIIPKEWRVKHLKDKFNRIIEKNSKGI
jgi:transposase